MRRKDERCAVVLCPLRIEGRAVRRALARVGLKGGMAEVVVTGPGAAAVRRGVEGVVQEGPPRVIVLAGLGGGLVELAEAVPVIGRVVDADGAGWACPAGGGEGVAVVGVDQPVVTVEAKRELRERTGAAIVDMESHGFAAACAAVGGLRWGVVRGVSDAWDEGLPQGVGEWVDGAGRTRAGRVVGDLMRRPVLVRDVVRLGRRSGRVLGAVGVRVVELIRREGGEV